MAPCASHLALSPSLTLFASTLDGLGASLVALPPLCACGLQFQDEILDELQSVWEKKNEASRERRKLTFVA